MEAYLHTWAAPRLVGRDPLAIAVQDGMIMLGDKPGLGLELLPDLHRRADAVVRVS